MKPKANNKARLTADASAPYEIGSVISRDGTKIGYRHYGHGPGIVLEQGGMGTAQNFAQLAEALASSFSVFVPDRRGRGLSPYSRPDYSIQEDVEDLDAVLKETGAHYLFGLSTGGLISLQAALTIPAIRKLAIYEPGLSVNGSTPLGWVQRYEKEMAQGNIAAALITGMLGPKMGPPIMNYIPRPLLEAFTKRLLAQEDRNGSGEYASMRALIPTLHHDAQLLIATSDTLDRYRTLPQEVLLLNGSKSAEFQRFSVSSLERTLPHVKRVELSGLNHGGVWNHDKKRNPTGRPELVAQELRRFFA